MTFGTGVPPLSWRYVDASRQANAVWFRANRLRFTVGIDVIGANPRRSAALSRRLLSIELP